MILKYELAATDRISLGKRRQIQYFDLDWELVTRDVGSVLL